MYSAVDFGCPFTSIRPSLDTSTPTDIMFEASTTSIGNGPKGSPSTASSDTSSCFRYSGSAREATRLLSSIGSASRFLRSPPILLARKDM